jgi:hypothetical protein
LGAKLSNQINRKEIKMKTIMITIQIDDVTAANLSDIEKKVDEALKEYKRKQINYSLHETFGPPLALTEE